MQQFSKVKSINFYRFFLIYIKKTTCFLHDFILENDQFCAKKWLFYIKITRNVLLVFLL